MARPKKLKVFRTPIGFHDAYVAAPSQKAALEAWGSDSNLFAAGAAELVTDPKLTKEPLAQPGAVIRKLRGSEAEQIKALGKRPAKAKRGPVAGSEVQKASKPAKRTPRPSRDPVDKAEKALESLEARHRDAMAKLKSEADKLERGRRDLEREQRAERERLLETVDEARDRYSAAMTEWAE